MSNSAVASSDLIEGIVKKVKTNGMFDEMRRGCLADIDTKPAFQNLKQRVENFVNALLSSEVWTPLLNKNQLRSKVRNAVMQSGMLNSGIEHILHQVVDAQMYTQFLPKITDFVNEHKDVLWKEFVPPTMIPKTEQIVQEAEGEIYLPITLDTPPVPLTLEKNVPEESNFINKENPKAEQFFKLEAQIQNEEDKADGEEEEEQKELENISHKPLLEEDKKPMIPDDAANTLRNLLQSLMGSNIQSLLTQDKETNPAGLTDQQNISPAIDPSNIEAFTDESNISVCPQTPDGTKIKDESDDVVNFHVTSSRKSSESSYDTPAPDATNYYTSENHSDPDNTEMQSDEEILSSEIVDNCALQSTKFSLNDMEEEEEDLVQSCHPLEIDVEIEEVAVLDVQDGSIFDGECLFVQNSLQGLDEVIVTEGLSEGSGPESCKLAGILDQHGENKNQNMRQHGGRQLISSVDSSNDSGQIESSPLTEREVESDQEEIHQLRSRKKRRKKRSKKQKRQKTKMRDFSPLDRNRDECLASEYSRSNVHQRHHVLSSVDRLNHFEEDNRAVKVEPVFMPQMTSRYRESYASHCDMEVSRLSDTDRGAFSLPHVAQTGFQTKYSPQDSYVPRIPSRLRFSPPYPRQSSFYQRSGSPPQRRYSPTSEYFRGLPSSDNGAPQHSPTSRRFSPQRQMTLFSVPINHTFPPPTDNRTPMLGSMSNKSLVRHNKP